MRLDVGIILYLEVVISFLDFNENANQELCLSPKGVRAIQVSVCDWRVLVG